MIVNSHENTAVHHLQTRIVLQCKNISKAFAAFQVIQGFQFELCAGEILSLLGPSGCGKTTLLRIIAGLESVSAGEVELDGAKVEGPTVKCGLLCQEPVLYPWLTSIENIVLALTRSTETKRSRHAIALGFLEMVGLEHFSDFSPQKLSGGQKRRLGLAACLAANPTVLLMDEPFSGLDELSKLEIRDVFLSVCRVQNLTALLVTHDVDDALYLSQRILILSPRPTSVVEEIKPLFGEDRQRSLFLSEEFLKVEIRVRAALRNATINYIR